MKSLIFILLSLFVIQSVAGYGYNLTVSLYPDGAKPTTGKMVVYLNGPNFEHKVELQPHMVPIYNGLSYSFFVDNHISVDTITYVGFKWRRKILGNSGPKTLPVMKVTVDPMYIMDSNQRKYWTRSYCGSPGYTVVKADTKVSFANRC